MIQSCIYFDNAATTPILPSALKTYVELNEKIYGNSSSAHQVGKQAERVLQDSQKRFADYFKVPASHVVFTSGGTESNNLAVWGALGGLTEAFYWLKSCGSSPHKGQRILTSTVEHTSTQKVFETLESMGALVGWVGVDQNCILSEASLQKLLDRPIRLASFHHVQSEIGVVQNIPQISKKIRQHSPDAFLHLDAVQSFLKVPLSFEELGVDLISISSHKIGGPKGIGALILGPRFVSTPQKLGKFIEGSSQQSGMRPGTVPVPLIGAFATAFEHGLKNFENHRNQLFSLRNYFIENLPKKISYAGPSVDSTLRSPQTVNFSVPHLTSSLIVEMLSERGFQISAGSACNSGSSKPNQTILEMGLGKKAAFSSVRVSFSYSNTKEEIDRFIKELHKICS